MPVFSHAQRCATNSFGATRSPPLVPSLSLCRLALAGGGAVKFQHLLHITPNYYALLLRLPSLSLCLLRFPASREEPGSGPGRPPGSDNGRPTPSGLRAFCVLRSFSVPRTNTAREPAPCRHTRIHAYSRAVSIHILAHRPLLPSELRESLSGASDMRVPPTRAQAGREERRTGPTAALLPAPVEAVRVGRGAEPEFRKRRGWLSSMKSYS